MPCKYKNSPGEAVVHFNVFAPGADSQLFLERDSLLIFLYLKCVPVEDEALHLEGKNVADLSGRGDEDGKEGDRAGGGGGR